MKAETISVECCIAGGGPAGMMAGFLLARAGVRVLVIEKHGDFLRDFRGDTIHPSTLEIMHELGLLEDFLRLPHQEATALAARVGGVHFIVADFSHLPTRCRFIAFMPQWDFLNFIAEQGRRYSTFALRMQAEATGLIEEDGRIVGIAATTPEGPLEIRAPLIIGADGRHSVLREGSGLAVEEIGAPMDVLWFSLPRRGSDPAETMGTFDAGQIFVTINRGDHWQCGFVIPKGALSQLHAMGLQAFQSRIAALADFAADRVHELRDWAAIKLLTVRVNRLRRWHRPGLLFIGDAAHAMSPVGGVGINLAIQDAVAAANILARPLREGRLEEAHLARLQRRRTLPAQLTQRLQVLVQDRVIRRVLEESDGRKLAPPLFLRLSARFPFLRRMPARLVGMGIRPEHVAAILEAR